MRLENGNIKCDLIRRGFNGRGVSPPPHVGRIEMC